MAGPQEAHFGPVFGAYKMMLSRVATGSARETSIIYVIV